MMFPSTPSGDLVAALSPSTDESEPRAVISRRPVVSDSSDWRPDRERFAQLSRQSRRTIRQLLDAGGRLFAVNGYHHCSVDQIVAEAGMARGTFYKYFEDKQDLLVTLSRECAEKVIRTTEQFAGISPDADGADARREWLTHHVGLHRNHSGIFRMWIEQAPNQPELDAAAHIASTAALLAFASMLRRLSRSYPLDPMAAALMLHGLIEAFPERSRTDRDDPALVDVMMRLVERGFLNPGTVEGKQPLAVGQIVG
jgi:AcrR family transcriptional regulator